MSHMHMEFTGGEVNVLDPGTMVKCVTCYDVEIEGEVAAFDFHRKALFVVSPPAPGSKHTNNTFHLLNLINLKKLSVISEPTGENEHPSVTLDTNKLTRRVKEKIEEKRRSISNIGIGVSEEAQSLFNSIKKTIEDTHWERKTIVVLGDVTIVEPYTVNNLQLRPNRNPNSLDHISKIVRKHYDDKKMKKAF